MRLLLCFVILLSLAGCQCQQSKKEMPTEIVVTPSKDFVHPGDEFDVQIAVTPNADIAGFQASISFDPGALEVNGVSEGNLFSQGGASTFFYPGTTTIGSVEGMACVILGAGLSVNTSGTFVTLHCTANLAGKTSDFALSAIIVASVEAQPLPFDSPIINQVSVGSSEDVNLDGSIDSADLQLVTAVFLTATTGPEDVNNDGVVNVLDLVRIAQLFAVV